jgi:hypothetical protein
MLANPVASRQIPYADQQGIILRTQGIISSFGPQQGIRRKTDPLAPTHPTAEKGFLVEDKKIINIVFQSVDDHAWLRTGPRVLRGNPDQSRAQNPCNSSDDYPGPSALDA